MIYAGVEGSTVVGDRARDRAIRRQKAGNLVTAVKRCIGEDHTFSSLVRAAEVLQIPTGIVRSKTDFKNSAASPLDYAALSIPDFKVIGATFSPEHFTSLLIHNASNIADSHEVTSKTPPLSRCVLVVPGHWPAHKRCSYLVAARSAGFESDVKRVDASLMKGKFGADVSKKMEAEG